MELLGKVIGAISGFMYSKLLIVMLIGVGLFFTIATRFIQGRLFGESIRVVGEKPDQKGAVSSFQALMVSTASRVGTGNIIGVSTAICFGGFGSIFWMWIIAIIGGASAFVESTLAQIYKRKRPEDGSYYGGPSYYIEAALKNRVLAVVFAVSMVLTYAGGFNALCAYNLQSTFSAYRFYDKSVTPIIIGAVIALLFGYCLMGGGKRIISATSTMVPIMGVLYVVVALVVILRNIGLMPGIFQRIFAEAFDFQAIFGGFTGSCMMYGIKRGLYSNEAGCGSAPNAAAAADVSHPVKQGLVQMLSVFIDTLLLCTATAFLCLSSGIEPTGELAGAPYVQEALRVTLGGFGPLFITVSMVLFAFTTLIGNFFYMDNLLIYLHKGVPSKNFMTGFRIVGTLVVFAGAIMDMGLLWDTADVLMGVMAIINLPVILALHRVVLGALRDYDAQREAGKNPVFKAASIGMEDQVECWK